MDKVKVIEIKKSVFEDNDREADQLRSELKGRGVFLLNLMSSPGSGKTTTLYMVLEEMAKRSVNISTIEDPVEKNLRKIKYLRKERFIYFIHS